MITKNSAIDQVAIIFTFAMLLFMLLRNCGSGQNLNLNTPYTTSVKIDTVFIYDTLTLTPEPIIVEVPTIPTNTYIDTTGTLPVQDDSIREYSYFYSDSLLELTLSSKIAGFLIHQNLKYQIRPIPIETKVITREIITKETPAAFFITASAGGIIDEKMPIYLGVTFYKDRYLVALEYDLIHKTPKITAGWKIF